MNIQWYPGHMTKTRRMIGENLKYVDVVAEVIDARIPIASRNPDIDDLVGSKPRVVILNRADQADPAASKQWAAYFRSKGISVLECDARSGAGVKQFSPVMRGALKEQIARWKEKGQVGRPVRAMVVGIPNVGKSTFINKVAKKKSAKAGDRPGVTRGKQWITVDQGLELLDTPGILWPKFEDETIGLHLAFTGAVNHSGDILAVGGVNRKIEGFFALCARRGLSGEQGVIIPRDNVEHLMLDERVVDAVRAGTFFIYPVSHISEALELLTGMNAGRRRKDGSFTRGSLFRLVDERLHELGWQAENAFKKRRRGA